MHPLVRRPKIKISGANATNPSYIFQKPVAKPIVAQQYPPTFDGHFIESMYGEKMTIRMFRCTECGHKMRLSGTDCGYCHTIKAPTQRPECVVLTLIAIFAIIVAVGLAVL
jgi:hypothetical protein